MITRIKKIMVAVAADEKERRNIIKQLLMRCGFAITASDAAKLIREDPLDFDMVNSYFIAAQYLNFRQRPTTIHKMIVKALGGDLVIVGTKKIPPEYEPFCEPYYVNDF